MSEATTIKIVNSFNHTTDTMRKQRERTMLYHNENDNNTYAITVIKGGAGKHNTVIRAKIPQEPVATFNIHRKLASEFTTHHTVDVEIGTGVRDRELKNWRNPTAERTIHPRIHTVLLLPKIFPRQNAETPSVPLGLYYGVGAYDRKRGVPRFLEIGNDKNVIYGSGIKITQKVPQNITNSTILPYPMVTAIISGGYGADWLISTNLHVRKIVETLKDLGYRPNTKIKNTYGRINAALEALNNLGRRDILPEAIKLYDTLLARAQSGDVWFLEKDLRGDLSALYAYLALETGKLSEVMYPAIKTYPYLQDAEFAQASEELDLQNRYPLLTIQDDNPVLRDIQHLLQIEARANTLRTIKYVLAHRVADRIITTGGFHKDRDLIYDLMEHIVGFTPDPRPPITITSLPTGWIYPKTHLWNNGLPIQLTDTTSVDIQTRSKNTVATVVTGNDKDNSEYFVIKILPKDGTKGVPTTSSALILTKSGELAGIGTITGISDNPKWIKKIPSFLAIRAPILSSISREYPLLAEELISPSIQAYKMLSRNKHARKLAQIGPQSHADMITTSGYAITKPLANEIAKHNKKARLEISEMERAIDEYGRRIITQKTLEKIARQFTIINNYNANLPTITYLETIARNPLEIIDEQFRKYVKRSDRDAKDPVLLKMALLHRAITKGSYAGELIQKAVTSPKWKDMALYVIGMNELLHSRNYYLNSKRKVGLIDAAKHYGKNHRA